MNSEPKIRIFESYSPLMAGNRARQEGVKEKIGRVERRIPAIDNAACAKYGVWP